MTAPKRPLDQLHLADLINLAVSNGVIDAGPSTKRTLRRMRGTSFIPVEHCARAKHVAKLQH